MKVYECGSDVKTRIGHIEGKITGVTIRFEAVAYEISYFDGDMNYKSVWLNEIEFEIINGSKRLIGFKNST